MQVDVAGIVRLLEAELEADRTFDDVTTHAVFEHPKEPCLAKIISRETGIFCGTAVIEAFQSLASGKLRALVPDGRVLASGMVVAEFDTSIGECLSLERTLLNCLSHICGVATLTHRFVQAVKPLPTRILATRKTLPGLRSLELMAVKAGGGFVHRRSLSDGILIKDNHLTRVAPDEAVRRAKKIRSPLHRVELEVDSLGQLEKVLDDPPDVILLDNMNIETLQRAVQMIGDRCEVEISGGVDLSNVRVLAELGVDYISVGKITHSAPALNLSLEVAR